MLIGQIPQKKPLGVIKWSDPLFYVMSTGGGTPPIVISEMILAVNGTLPIKQP